VSQCDRITLLLTEDGPAALRGDPEGQEHVAGCDACFELLVGVQELEQDLFELPTAPVDDALRERVVRAARTTAPGASPTTDPEPVAPEPPADDPEVHTPPGVVSLTRRRRVLALLRSHKVLAIGTAVVALLTLMLVPTTLLLTRYAGDAAQPAMSWDEAPDRTATLPSIGQPQSGESTSVYKPDDAVAGDGLIADLSSDGWNAGIPDEVAREFSGIMGGSGEGDLTVAEASAAPEGETGGDEGGFQTGRRPADSQEPDFEARSPRRRSPGPTAHTKSRPSSGSASHRQQRLEEEAADVGLLAIVGATSSTSNVDAVADLLSDADSMDVGEALARSSGVSIARPNQDDGKKRGDKDGDGLTWTLQDLPIDAAMPAEWEPEPAPEPTPEPIAFQYGEGEEQKGKEGRTEDTRNLREEEPKAEPPEIVLGLRGLDDEEQLRGGRDEPLDLNGLRQDEDSEDDGRFRTRALGPVDNRVAQEYIEDNQATEGVAFQRASGYWENRYVPGDPTLRRLHRRLSESDRSELGLPGAEAMMLDAAARQYSQPFDRPADSALAVYLHGDRRGVQGETRMRLQVGVQATQRGSGRRTAMNVGVVLDLRHEPRADDAAAIRALLEALSQARDSGDTISLTVAGRPGGMVLPPGDFRYGPVAVALEELLTAAPDGPVAAGPTLTLPMALRTAATSVQSIDDPSQPLGSSLILLVSAGQLDGQARRLSVIAHDSAVAGVPVSVVGVGDQADLPRLEEVALAGQGNRRVMSSPGEARDLVDRELTAVSHVVARAVRLRIKLAPGVKLVEVLGSRRLDALRSQRVREAEQSIDQRLSKNMGIQADRGEDEEGIQIVVPTWYSGDAHVVLLDVVVPGPGPVAEVTVRYKDLVHLRNGVARSSLRLTHDASLPGPLEHNVVRNVLAMELSDVLGAAAHHLEAGHESDAIATLAEFTALVQGLQLEAPALYDDPEVHADLQMVAEYVALLNGTAVQGAPPMAAPAARAYVRDSLEYASFNKINPRIQSELE
jgi:hypothetical protein